MGSRADPVFAAYGHPRTQDAWVAPELVGVTC